MRVVTTNHAAGATVLGADGLALPAATGYAAADLVRGTLDRPWRAASSALVSSIVLDIGAARSITAAAVFDVFASVSGSPRVSVYTGTTATGPWTKQADLTHGGRRDWGGFFAAASSRYWKVEIQPSLSLPTQPEVACIVLGAHQDLRRAETGRDVESVEQILTNGSQATKTGEEFVRLSLRWGTLDATDHAELYALKRTLGGGLYPVALWPDAGSPGRVYWGRIGAGMRWTESVPVYTGHALEFAEMERVLRG